MNAGATCSFTGIGRHGIPCRGVGGIGTRDLDPVEVSDKSIVVLHAKVEGTKGIDGGLFRKLELESGVGGAGSDGQGGVDEGA